MTDIGVMVRTANPVPDESQQLTDDELSAVLLLAQQRSGDMDVKELTKPVEPDGSSRPGWLIAALAFGAIIVVVGAAMLLTRDTTAELPPATTPPTTEALPATTVAPVETAEEPVEESAEPIATVSAAQVATIKAYEDAVNSGNAEELMSMLGSGFRYTDEGGLGEGWFTSAEGWINEQLVHIVEGSMVSYTECELEGAVISCLETWSGPMKTAITGGDWTYRADFALEDGVVASIHGTALQWPEAAVHARFYEEMIDWVGEVDSESAALLADCVIDAGNQDLDLWPLCVEWAQLWIDAGRP